MMKNITQKIVTMICLVVVTLPVKATLDKQVTQTDLKKKVLMVVSGHGEEQGEKAPGYEFGEFSKAYLVFQANGIDVDVASPKGGNVVADKYDPATRYNAQTLADEKIMDKLANTFATANINAASYDGVFIVGGKGAMFDLPKDKALQTLISDVYQQQGAVAAVCHGPAALVDVKLADGTYLIANKHVNGFTNEEEQLFGKKWSPTFDFMLEDKLVERGAIFQSSDIMLSHVAVDDRLITGQNPSSTVGVATALVTSLGIDAVAHEVYQEDRTLALIADFLAGDRAVLAQASQRAASEEKSKQLSLFGMYGFYFFKVAEKESEIAQALDLMTMAQAELNNPVLDVTIAKAQQKLGKNLLAKTTLRQLLKTKPEYQPALELLATL
ncbi:type 1 glutamine amidotransferase domain-containing protein [Colwellia sp. D2M02]|uniref:type 1 glutamine amidotransferase domain-containing protein n=1 Tax=Colwellia sp. D2M02 TaxID=2841562 RepID=UPI0020906F08|nr:type 1 glutamine amidotransferase domain-containing protein [Colwellia sp. D2M02]